MKQGALKKQDIGRLLHEARKSRKVYAPVRQDRDVLLTELLPGQEPTLDYLNFKLSCKSIFFPQREILCAYRDQEVFEALLPEEKVLVFGVRPCDARSLVCLDKIFGEFGGSKDPYYLRRRENAVIITMACTEPDDACFCTSVGGDVAGAEGSDVLVFPVGDSLIFDAQTEKGVNLMNDYSTFFGALGEAESAARDDIVRKARAKLPVMDLANLKAKLERSFDSDIWDRIPGTCLGCGLCTYQCPTCHCFDISDEGRGRSGSRIRTWDSCQFNLFTKHASGHNPRPGKRQRMRQRILHKFLYTVENVGCVFCVGCGRCVRNCPVNLDVREILKALVESKT